MFRRVPALSSKLRSKLTIAWPIWVIAALLCLAIVFLAWPGTEIGDNIRQLSEIRSGRLTDWHPPLMSVVWRALGTTAQSMLILDCILYWVGFACLADQLRREKGSGWALAMLAIGLSPLSVYYLGRVQKDTLMAALFVLATGLGARFGRGYAAIPAFLGMLARANAVFAAPPLLLRTKGLLATLLLSIVLALALIPLSTFINRSLFGAEASHVEKSLQLFDIAGSGQGEFMRCYTPFEWDTLQSRCHAFDRSPDDLTGRWLTIIAEHPVAYALHRLSFFNHAIFFLVPPRQECVAMPQDDSCTAEGAYPLLKDAITRNALFWPVTWLVVGFVLLLLPLDPLARSLALSGMMYGLAYLVVGVASGFRYFYWTELSVQIALLWQLAHGLPRWRWIAWAVLATWIAGYAWRYLPLLF